ncbi:hypothetical protein [Rufibacter quisquiliarum]|uniref:SIR2-like domain-containing protein n=1 Tax=Rufibacter quisquiliarum TaxID=1549639 RepID=A0A839GNQ2_9BACT|nr:hypothetical protein [Rufibacter quisquiliarum]MBA9076547.1 hypothetical protein [Rufibacter quisquiliarum]
MEDDKFKKIVESCHLNFLIGSGASRNYFETLGNVENILTELSAEPASNEKTIVEVSIKSDYFQKAILGNRGLIDSAFATDPTELANTKQNYIDFLIAINIILLRRKSSIIGKQVNLFTTNMDIFLDTTLEQLNIEYNDGFSGKLNPTFSTSNYRKSIFQKSPHYENKAELPLFNLYKLHGSVTWKTDANDIVFDASLSTLSKINKVRLSGKLLSSLKDATGKDKKLTELFADAKSLHIDSEFEKFIAAYRQLVMINPTKDKFETTTIQYTYYELLRIYSNELEKENSILFVFGFSFADEHIREITKRVANSNPTLLICIFAYSDSSKLDIEGKLQMNDFKFQNVEVITSGDFATLNKSWFIKLAHELDKESFEKRKGDIVVNVTLPPAVVA